MQSLTNAICKRITGISLACGLSVLPSAAIAQHTMDAQATSTNRTSSNDSYDAIPSDEQLAETTAETSVETPASERDVPQDMPLKTLAGIVAVGAGVAITGAGVVFAIKGSQDDEEARTWNPNDAVEQKKIKNYNERTLPFNRAMTVTGLTIGGTTLVVGVILIMLGQRTQRAGDQPVTVGPGGIAISF
ncbi:MAG: hypothetical protein JXR76_30255 [Deltaproteobacteria bacterium]|nr:hypothetical protein [Deltaproteobacteria bacterium]